MYWSKIKNNWINADIPDGFLFTETVRVFHYDTVYKTVSNMELEIQKLKDEIKNREFIECPCCGYSMQWINNTEYGCSNENCNSLSRIC